MQRTNIIKSAIIKRAVRDCNGVVFWYVLLILSISENQTKHGQASTYSAIINKFGRHVSYFL